MTQRIYVGNLPFSATEGEIAELFGQYGEVVSCSLPKDRETGRSEEHMSELQSH